MAADWTNPQGYAEMLLEDAPDAFLRGLVAALLRARLGLAQGALDSPPPDRERVDPETLAYTLSEHVADIEPEPEEYLERFADELFQLKPALRERFSDLLIGELKAEIGKDETSFAHECVAVIESVEADWRQDA